MKRILALLALIAFFSACGSGKEDDTVSAPSSTSVTDNDSCPVDVTAESAEEAVEEAEAATGGEVVSLEDLGLDQNAALRTYRVFLKDVTISIFGCDNTVSIEDNDSTSDDDTSVDLGGQASE